MSWFNCMAVLNKQSRNSSSVYGDLGMTVKNVAQQYSQI